jgi:hypothetical protein
MLRRLATHAAHRTLLTVILATGLAATAVTAAQAGPGPTRPPAPTTRTPAPSLPFIPIDPSVVKLLYPDLTVEHVLPDASGREAIVVGNIGHGAAGPFRVAVLAGANSYSIPMSGLDAGQYEYIRLEPFDCKEPVAVIVDADKQTGDTDYANNGTGFTAGCPIDGGSHNIPVDN